MKKESKLVVIAGATGYLGGYLVQAAKDSGYRVRALVRPGTPAVRNPRKADEIFYGEAIKPGTLEDLFDGASGIISSLGITRQKDGLTYRDVDYQANQNLLEMAIGKGIPRFAYVSVFNGEKIRNTKLGSAKEQFVKSLQGAGIQSLVIRPTGFFSDMRDFYDMAASGKVYLFGKGETRMNPIHGRDLAEAIMDAWEGGLKELEIGGPVVYTAKELAELAIRIYIESPSGSADGKIPRIVFLPDWIRRITLKILPVVTPEKVYGPIQFFLSAMGYASAAPRFGVRRLEEFYRNISS